MVSEAKVQEIFMSVKPPVKGFVVDRFTPVDAPGTHIVVFYQGQYENLSKADQLMMDKYLLGIYNAIEHLGGKCVLKGAPGYPDALEDLIV